MIADSPARPCSLASTPNSRHSLNNANERKVTGAHPDTATPLPKCDAVYVNAAATSPLPLWLDALSPMGRLIFPLTPAEGAGAMLLIIKQRVENAPARFLCRTLFAHSTGCRREETARKPTTAFQAQRWTQVRSFRRNSTSDKSCWFSDEDWWLSTNILTGDGTVSREKYSF